MADFKSATAGSLTLTRPCVKCRAQEATLDSRSQAVCRDCFTKFISAKCIKQIGILGKETRPPPSTTNGPPTGTRRYLLGLSFGVSSTVLLHLLNDNVEFQLARGRSAPFELTVIHIDDTPDNQTDHDHPSPSSTAAASEIILAQYRARYPRFTFHSVPLSSALANDPLEPSSSSSSSSSSSLPPPPRLKEAAATTPTAAITMSNTMSTTTTAASRSDLERQLTRRALLAQARARRCQALLLGHSTTALAETALAEAAKGRGFAVPWLVGDGAAPSTSPPLEGGEEGAGGGGVNNEDAGAGVVLVYHPLRDALRKELVTYAGLVDPPLTDLIDGGVQDSKNGGSPRAAAGAAVVSHKDLSIEEVMRRYFAEVEENYPSVVANVARTTGKLVRAGEGAVDGERCGLCGMPLDKDGDERWRGELGIQERTGTGPGFGNRLCYGCERSTAG
ncbi:hypothetical protein C7999DRAFT_11607 [Corynascus novoguineensis]|uniref:Cytoplasmic tRNA 2-thiolation protein 2 n=1 Tax=Corynascus novoguineensis TaxID=1126955 RepID=A0AAN7CZ04_9PEZI|nr:hypothetical protein C7999DRAFT_11607 [Corynascus novoguineensis]